VKSPSWGAGQFCGGGVNVWAREEKAARSEMKSAVQRDARARGLWFMGPPRKLLRVGSRWLKRKANDKKYTPIAEGLVRREISSECGEEWQNCKFKTRGGRPPADRLCRQSKSPASSDDLGVSGFYSIHKDVVVVHNQPTRVDRRRGHNRIVRFLRIILECLGFALEWIFVREGDDERMTVGFPGQRITLT